MSTSSFPVIKNTAPKLPSFNMDEIAFGKNFTDHMLVADYENGEWKNVVIKPYEPLQMDPSCATLHYGQTIFEGIKAFKNEKEEVVVFAGKLTVALLAALTAVQTFAAGQSLTLDSRLPAVLIAALLYWKKAPFIVAVAAAALVAALLRNLLGWA